MLSSVQAGLARLSSTVTAALVWPVDIPFVAPATVRTIVMHDGTIVVPTHNGRGGHPLRLGAALVRRGGHARSGARAQGAASRRTPPR